VPRKDKNNNKAKHEFGHALLPLYDGKNVDSMVCEI
jgi:hypothetical protein